MLNLNSGGAMTVGTKPVKDSTVRKPSDMIVIGDVRSDATTINFNANLDPVIDNAGDIHRLLLSLNSASMAGCEIRFSWH